MLYYTVCCFSPLFLHLLTVDFPGGSVCVTYHCFNWPLHLYDGLTDTEICCCFDLPEANSFTKSNMMRTVKQQHRYARSRQKTASK